MHKTISAATRSVILSVSLVALGCNAAPTQPTEQERAAGSPEGTAERAVPADAPPSPVPVSPGELIEARDPGKVFDPADYIAQDRTYRLFGVEPGDGTTPPTAILADTATWSTRIVKEGELFGRSYRVARVDARGVALRPTDGQPIVLEPGQDARLRVIRHKLDVVVRSLGRHRYALDAIAARAAYRANPTRPAISLVDVYGGPAVRLGKVAEGTLFHAAGFQEADLVAGVDAANANDETVGEIERSLMEGRAFTVRLFRGGVAVDRTFVTAAP